VHGNNGRKAHVQFFYSYFLFCVILPSSLIFIYCEEEITYLIITLHSLIAHSKFYNHLGNACGVLTELESKEVFLRFITVNILSRFPWIGPLFSLNSELISILLHISQQSLDRESTHLNKSF
jgi:hypothetical protein